MGLWHPASEAEAVSERTVFIEWLRATGILPDASPARLAAWAAAAPEAHAEARALFLATPLP